MTEKEFIQKAKKNIEYVQKYIDKINELARKGEPIRFFSDRLNMLLIAGSKIEECQNLYLQYTTENPVYEPQIVVRFDYKTSEFANRIFKAIQGMLNYYFKSKQDKDKKKELDKISLTIIQNIVKVSNKMLYISARWFSERQMQVWDLNDTDMPKPYNKQKLPRRLPLLHDVFPCFDRVLATKMGLKFDDGFQPKKLVVCLPPSSGKTYEANIYCNQMLSHHKIRYKETGMIRMTNTAENAYNYGSQVHKMMIEPRFAKIFPEFRCYEAKDKLKMFTYESREKYLLKDCNPECSDSMFLFGSEASINGKRAPLGSTIDDLSGGQGDMDNDELHKKQTDKIISDVLDRSDDDDSPIVIMGTMYNENDAQNAFISLWESKGLIPHPTLKSVRMTKDGTCAVCLVDIEDEDGNSVAPDLYPNEKLQEKKSYFISRGKPYVYNLIYRQRRDSRDPKEFADDTLMHYKWGELPEGISEYSLSTMDLTRKTGNDYFSNPYLRYNPSDGLYYLTDAIFEQKSLGLVNDPKNEFRDKVCYKIMSTNCVECCIENNTSNTTGTLLQERCRELKYQACKFRERFTSKQGNIGGKVQRILNMSETIKNYIVFPQKDTIPVGHPLFQFMEQLNNWDSKNNSRTNHDDAPDSLAMFATEFIFKKASLAEIKGAKLSDLW